MRKLTILAINVALLTGCVSNIPSKYDHSTITGAGMTKAELITKLGIPSRTMKIDDNITAYQWDSDQGSTSVGHLQSNSIGGAYGQSQREFGGETNAGAIGSSDTVGNSTGDITTHVCAYSANLDNNSNKVVSADLVGSVDNKCLSHFEKMLTLDSTAVAKHDEVVHHNKNVRDYAAWWLLLPIPGYSIYRHSKNDVALEIEPVR